MHKNGLIKSVDTLSTLKDALKLSSEELRKKWVKQLIYKLYMIHSKFKSIHGNICLEALKINNEDNLILDGFSEKLIDKSEVEAKYKSPEFLIENKASKAGDIWAAGICIYFINNLAFPWKVASNNDENYKTWVQKGLFTKGLNNFFHDILKSMLCVDILKRVHLKAVILHKFECIDDSDAISKFVLFYSY